MSSEHGADVSGHGAFSHDHLSSGRRDPVGGACRKTIDKGDDGFAGGADHGREIGDAGDLSAGEFDVEDDGCDGSIF